MNKQEIFDKVTKHLYDQNCQAIDAGRTCRYRGDDGTMCAVGCLIKDEYYDPSLEGTMYAAEEFSGVKPAVNASVGRELTNDEVDLLDHLQQVHDNYSELKGTWRDYLRSELRQVALVHGLVYHHPEQTEE